MPSGSWCPADWNRPHPPSPACKNRIALAPPFAHNAPILARVLSAAVNGIEAFPVEVEVNCGWGDTIIVIVETIPQLSVSFKVARHRR